MTSRDFCYWLQGYLEISGTFSEEAVGNTTTLNKGQIKCIQKHLNLVFEHEIDPSMGNEGHQNTLNHLHNEPGVRC